MTAIPAGLTRLRARYLFGHVLHGYAPGDIGAAAGTWLLRQGFLEADAASRVVPSAEGRRVALAAAAQTLEDREGAPPELIEHARDEDLLAAALAPAGQPCADCGKLVVWTEDERGADWRHADTPTGCFLAREDER